MGPQGMSGPAARGVARTLGILGLCGGMALLPAPPVRAATAPPAPPPDLQGTWELNPDLTAQLAKEQTREGSSSGRQGGGYGGGGGGGHRRGGGGMGRGGGGAPHGGSAGDAEAGDDVGRQGGRHALDRLTIAQKDGEVTITDQEDRARVYKTNGAKVRDESAFGGPAEIQASWDADGALAIAVKPDKGPKRSESYVVSNDRKHLYLTLTTGGGFLKPEKKSVRAYDLAPPPAPEAAPAPAPAVPPPGAPS